MAILGALVIAVMVGALAGGSTASTGRSAPMATPKQYVFVFVRFPLSEGEFPNAIWEVSADGHELRNVITRVSDDDPWSPRWSPDGKTLAMGGVFSLRMKTNVLLLVDPNGGHRRELDGGDDCWNEIGWLPDGRSIACVSGRHIHIVGTQSRRSRLLRVSPTPGLPGDSLNAIDWSPRGDRFVTDDAAGVHVVAANGIVLATISKDGEFARWSHDGKHILFLEKAPNGDAIVVVNPTGTNRHVVIQVPTFDAVASAAWSPDGETIAYIGQTGLHVVDVQTGADRLLNRLAKLCGPNPQPGCGDLDWRAAGGA